MKAKRPSNRRVRAGHAAAGQSARDAVDLVGTTRLRTKARRHVRVWGPAANNGSEDPAPRRARHTMAAVDESGQPALPGPVSPPTLEQLQDLLLESPGFNDFLLELAVFSASQFAAPEPMMCAISVERDGHTITVASSSENARQMDEKQYGFDDGPCLTGLREGR